MHAPLQPAWRHRGRYRTKPYSLPPTYYQTLGDDCRALGWPEWVTQQRYSWHGVDFAYHEHSSLGQLVQTHCETLQGVDDSVGEVLNYLKQEGLDQNTLVIYMGDKGFSFGEHGLIDKRPKSFMSSTGSTTFH